MAGRTSAFRSELQRRRPRDTAGRRWLFLPYDQLSDAFGPLSHQPTRELGVVLVESSWKAARRPYHRQKLALVLANQRHFALEQAARGVAVEYVLSEAPYRDALRETLRRRRLARLELMSPAEHELRSDLQPLVDEELLTLLPHEGWLSSRQQFEASQPKGPPWRMDAFYRLLRRETGLLMRDDKPLGGKYSHDSDNRKPWPGEPPAPEPPRFRPDAVTREVGELIESRFGHHPGRLDLERLPATRDDAERQWQWALEQCLPRFGPYEDAMSRHSSGLFHTRISALLNLGRLSARRVLDDVIAARLPLSSQEGFVRQLLGWREFVRHVHDVSAGFRRAGAPLASAPGDAGWGAWSGRRWQPCPQPPGLDGGAAPAELAASEPLPAAWWGQPSGLACLDRVVADVWREAWSHHITRLMVLGNLATLLDVEPRQLCDWFWVAYTDAYDWVVEPNVLGMGSWALGELMTTKPYVSGAAYIARMSDYCQECVFDPRRDCPISSLYWAFLDRHRERLSGLRRLRLPLASLDKRAPRTRRADAAVCDWVRGELRAGRRLEPSRRPPA